MDYIQRRETRVSTRTYGTPRHPMPVKVQTEVLVRLPAGPWRSADGLGRWAQDRSLNAYDRRSILFAEDLGMEAGSVHSAWADDATDLGLTDDDGQPLGPQTYAEWRKAYTDWWEHRTVAYGRTVKHPKPSSLGRILDPADWPTLDGLVVVDGLTLRKRPRPKAEPKARKRSKPNAALKAERPTVRADGLVVMTHERTMELLRMAGVVRMAEVD